MAHPLYWPFDTTGFVPRWQCGAWSAELGYLHIAGDLAIWLAYLAIPVVLVWFVRRRPDVPFTGVFWLFGLFIVSCGTTHLLEAVIFYAPVYRLAAAVKLVTAVASLGTVLSLVRVAPRALAMRTPAELEAEVAKRTAELAAANAALRREIAERARAEAARAESEDRFRQLAESIPQLAWMADPDGSIFWYNRRWYEYTGTTPELMVGWGWRAVHDPAELERVVAKFRAAVAAGEPWEDTFPLRRADGAMRWHLSRALPLRDAGGRVVRWFGTNTDVTEQRELTAALARARDELERRVEERTAQLEAANQELEAFSYSVSHDLRAPLRAIGGFARIAADEYGHLLPPEGRECLAEVCGGARKMGRLVDDLLAFSRLGRQPIARRRVDAAALVRECLRELRPGADGRAVDVRVGDLPPCHGDPALLKQVWLNLLSNALKYTGGRADPVVEVTGAAGPGGPEYAVRDNGVGFDMRYAGKLFGVFQRLHTADAYEGTGVGLAIVHRVVTRHGGRVWAEAEPGRGATFRFALPTDGGPAHA